MGRALRAAILGLVTAGMAVGGARASGDGDVAPWYLDQYGGDTPDQTAFYDGHVGIVMARFPRPRLLAAWRMLHGLPVGEAIGKTLAVPCCNAPMGSGNDTVQMWLDARKAVPGAPALAVKDVGQERDGPNYTSIPTCADDAFQQAEATLKDRVTRYGAASPSVGAWLRAQDAVFAGCTKPGVTLPALAPDAPAWLRADHAYQDAAVDLYDGRSAQAAAKFAAIGQDAASPWRPWAPYLQARALEKQALAKPSPDAAAAARKAIDTLAAAPAGTPGKADVRDLSHILDFRYAPARLMAELDGDMRAPKPAKDLAILFRDYSDLSDKATPKPEIMDWMATMKALPDPHVDMSKYTVEDGVIQAQRDAIAAARPHALERWRATHDRAWLIAALSLTDAGAPGAAALIADARVVKPDDPAWLTVQFHLIRLTLAGADPAAMRTHLEALLGRKDLSVSDRNILMAQRLQLATDLHDLARWAVRKRLCPVSFNDTGSCVRQAWDSSYQQGPFDQNQFKGSVGLGEDARAIIDRLPLAQRIALSHDTALPANFRMDIALTSFARAVQLQDDASLDALAKDLEPMLPQLSEDWKRIPLAKPGPDKRFSAYQILVKIPGLRTDLVRYTRPSGRVVDFQRHWMSWIVAPKGHGDPGQRPLPLGEYQAAGYTPDFPYSVRDQAVTHAGDARAELSCLGECGRGAAGVHLPDFVQALQPQAKAERAFFIQQLDTENLYDYTAKAMAAQPKAPAGSVAVWDEMLAYAQAHPNDPRIPETLHWIVHASHFGASHDQSGKRAFQLLHRRYPQSVWARQTPTYSEMNHF